MTRRVLTLVTYEWRSILKNSLALPQRPASCAFVDASSVNRLAVRRGF